MSWGRQDDSYHDHPKILALSLEAVGLEWLAMSYANKHHTNGVISRAVARHLARGERTDLYAELVAVRRWKEHAEGYEIHNFLEYNESAQDAERRKKQARSRMRRHRAGSGVVRANTKRTGALRNAPVPMGRDGSGTGVVPSSSSEGGVGGFDRFWAAYPRKVAKQDAAKAWRALAPDITLEIRILGAVDHQRTWDAWTRDGGKFIPYPATWLNGRRWEDERPTIATPLLSPRGVQNQAAAEEWLRRKMPEQPAQTPTVVRLPAPTEKTA